jgi:hypothetical protein
VSADLSSSICKVSFQSDFKLSVLWRQYYRLAGFFHHDAGGSNIMDPILKNM